MDLLDQLFHSNGLKAKIPVEAVVVAETRASRGRGLYRGWCLVGSDPCITIRNLDITDIRDTIFHFILIDYRTSRATNCCSIGILMNRMIFRCG